MYLYTYGRIPKLRQQRLGSEPSRRAEDCSHDIRRWGQRDNWLCLRELIDEETMWVFLDLAQQLKVDHCPVCSAPAISDRNVSLV